MVLMRSQRSTSINVYWLTAWVKNFGSARSTTRISFSPQVRNPERLLVDLNLFQPAAGQICFCQAQKSEVRQVAEHRLQPSVLREDLAHSRIRKFISAK